MTIFKTALLLLLISIAQNLWATEQITSYHSDIKIQQNGQLHIIENIQVTVENNQIKHGIYRDFPTTYTTGFGTIVKVGFDLIGVKRNGIAENFHTSKQANGIRIYAGDQQTILAPGRYSYQIEYTTSRQIGFFKEYDELYFNITGHGWNFPILQASATLSLPARVDIQKITLNGYTGRQGSVDQFLTHHIEQADEFYFETTQILNPQEGFTIIANWPKGVISPPTEQQARNFFIDDNKHSLIAISGLLLVISYYVLVWIKVGKDPQAGVIVPIYQAPAGFSPASIRFISHMDYDKGCFTSAIVNLISNGFISLDQNDNKEFVMKKLPQNSNSPAAGESLILKDLFKHSDQMTISQSEHKRLSKAIESHETSLRENYEKLYFLTNKKYFIPGMVLSLISIILAILNIPDQEIMKLTISTIFFSAIPFFIFAVIYKQMLKKSRPMSIRKIITYISFLGIIYFIISDSISHFLPLVTTLSWPLVICFYLLVMSNIVFQQWLKAPTLAGRQLLDKIESFKLFLSVAEEDEIKLTGQPQFNTDIYQQFLPYAIALGVDNTWSEKLEHAIKTGIIEPDFMPRGFEFHHNYHSFTDFSSTLSNGLNTAISASSTPPGSTSGSTGGSAGGGGGGGGGGGW